MMGMTVSEMVAARAGLDAAMAKAAADTERARVELDEAIQRKVAETRAEALASMKATVDLYGFKADEVFDKRAVRKVPVKWRDPSTGAEWSGRGKAPKWFIADRSSEFAV
jgi:DNA-binding protein H-NS